MVNGAAACVSARPRVFGQSPKAVTFFCSLPLSLILPLFLFFLFWPTRKGPKWAWKEPRSREVIRIGKAKRRKAQMIPHYCRRSGNPAIRPSGDRRPSLSSEKWTPDQTRSHQCRRPPVCTTRDGRTLSFFFFFFFPPFSLTLFNGQQWPASHRALFHMAKPKFSRVNTNPLSENWTIRKNFMKSPERIINTTQRQRT